MIRRWLRPVRTFFVWLKYQYKIRLIGIDADYIHEAFAGLLAAVEFDEFHPVGNSNIWIKIWGNEISIEQRNWVYAPCPSDCEINHVEIGHSYLVTNYRCILKQSPNRQIYIDEWREQTREVILEFGARHVTNWWEIYRSGRLALPQVAKVIDLLHKLYGDSKCSAQQSNAVSTSPHIPKAGPPPLA